MMFVNAFHVLSCALLADPKVEDMDTAHLYICRFAYSAVRMVTLWEIVKVVMVNMAVAFVVAFLFFEGFP